LLAQGFRVGFDARPLVARWTGMRTYTVHLVGELLKIAPELEAWLYFHSGEPDKGVPSHPRLRWRKVAAPFGWWWTLFQLPAVLQREGIALFHADYLVPPLAPCPTIVTMHDAISAMFLEPSGLRARLVTNFLSLLSVHRSRFVLVPSASAKRDVCRLFRVAPEKVVVTPYGVSEQFQPMPKEEARRRAARQWGIEGRFVLTVNFFRPRKNAPILAAAFRELRKRKVSIDWLVFVGVAPDPLKQRLVQVAAEVSDRLIFTGYVPDDALPLLYNAAEVFAFPSRYEGFGLPVLEAMACGTPVVAGDAPAVNEIVGDAALLVPPNDWRALADAIERVLTDPLLAERLRHQGFRQAASFPWSRTATLTYRVYQAALRRL
jgi:glycosyltransferase involved in cell wall biosynthesis